MIYEIIITTLCVLSLIALGVVTYLFRLFYYERFRDLENFIIGLNGDVNQFKQTIDNITKSNILVYDENVFDIMTNCKIIKSKIDQYMSKYDEYSGYIYTEDISEEDVDNEPKHIFPLLRNKPQL